MPIWDTAGEGQFRSLNPVYNELKNPASGRPFGTFESKPIRMRQRDFTPNFFWEDDGLIQIEVDLEREDVLSNFHGHVASWREHAHRFDLLFIQSMWFLSHLAISPPQFKKNTIWK